MGCSVFLYIDYERAIIQFRGITVYANSINLEAYDGRVYVTLGADYVQSVRSALNYYQRHLPETDWDEMEVCADTHGSRLTLRAATRAAVGMCDVLSAVYKRSPSDIPQTSAYDKLQRQAVEFGAAALDGLHAQRGMGELPGELLSLAVELETKVIEIS